MVVPLGEKLMEQGYIEVVRPFQVRGWALDEEDPDQAVAVRVTLDEQTIATGLADLFREDLARSGVGNGRHGFVLNLRSSLSDGQRARIVVTGRSQAGVDFLLPALPTASPPREPGATDAQPQDPAAPLPGLGALLVADATERAHHPVFILGSARSGTSAIAQGLMKATRYQGNEEGHLLDLIDPIFHAIQKHYDDRGDEWASHRQTMIAKVPAQYFQDGFQQLLVVLARRLFPSGYWFDKTPHTSMIAAAPLLKRVWPEARFVFMKRRGIENVQSRMRKFPGVPFESHCRDWAASMLAWQSIREQLAGSAIEIDQLVLARDPAPVVRALSSFLMLQPQEAARLESALKLDQPERTSDHFDAAFGFDGPDWSDQQWATFRQACGPAMSAFGYSGDEAYFQARREGEGLQLR